MTKKQESLLKIQEVADKLEAWSEAAQVKANTTQDTVEEYNQTNIVLNYQLLVRQLRNVISELKETK